MQTITTNPKEKIELEKNGYTCVEQGKIEAKNRLNKEFFVMVPNKYIDSIIYDYILHAIMIIFVIFILIYLWR